MSNFLDKYLIYVQNTESPIQYHRWSILTSVAAFIGRKVYFELGHVGNIYPNMYTLLIGSPGTRKDAAIKPARDLILNAGYKCITNASTSCEQFLQDFATGFDVLNAKVKSTALEDAINKTKNVKISPAQLLAGLKAIELNYSQAFICIGEFAAFIGENDKKFTTELTALWDCLAEKQIRLRKTEGKQLAINKPTVNILGGMTPGGFNSHIGQEIKDGGFTARINLVFASKPSKKLTIPPAPDKSLEKELIADLVEATSSVAGRISIEQSAYKLLDLIYKKDYPPTDSRLLFYHDRRLTHLIKLTLVLCVLDKSQEIQREHVEEANTILTYTELGMSAAMGEYGTGKTAIAAQKTLDVLLNANRMLTMQELLASIQMDVDYSKNFVEMFSGLQMCGKVKEHKLPNGECVYTANTISIDSLEKENRPGVNISKYIKEVTSL